MSKFLISLIVLMVALITGCGGSGSSIPTTPATQTTVLNAFDLTGSDAPTNGVTPINAAIDNGAFRVEWNVNSSDPYHVDLYISDNNALDEITDIRIFNQNCGSIALLYNCNAVGSFDCKFTSENKMSCGTVTPTNPDKDLTSFLTTIPQSAFLFIKACNALFDSCKTSSIAIELQ